MAPDQNFSGGRRVQVFLKKLDASQWQQVVDWIQPADWTPPTDRPDQARLRHHLPANNPPNDGVVWFKDIQFRVLNTGTAPATVSVPGD